MLDTESDANSINTTIGSEPLPPERQLNRNDFSVDYMSKIREREECLSPIYPKMVEILNGLEGRPIPSRDVSAEESHAIPSSLPLASEMRDTMNRISALFNERLDQSQELVNEEITSEVLELTEEVAPSDDSRVKALENENFWLRLAVKVAICAQLVSIFVIFGGN